MTHSETLNAQVLRPGDWVERSVTFDCDSIRAYAAMVGDWSPWHHDEAVAARSRFGGLIASGSQTSGIMLGVLTQFILQRHTSLGLEFSFQLKKAVRANMPFTIFWEVATIEPKPSLGGDIALFKGKLTNAQMEIAILAENKSVLFPKKHLLCGS